MKDAKGHGSNQRGTHSEGIMSIAAKLQSATFGTHLTQFPSGKFGFTGHIPDELAFEASNPKYIQDAKNHGAGLVSKVAANEGGYLRTRTWKTRKAAQAALDAYNKKSGV